MWEESLRKEEINKETQFNSNLLSNQEPPLLLPRPHLTTAKSIRAQPLHSDTDKRVVTWNMFIYSQRPLEHEDGCFKLILCKGTNCQGKAFPCYPWMHPDMEIFQCSQGLYRDFCPPGKYWIIMVILIRVSDNTLKRLTCWKLSFYRTEAQVCWKKIQNNLNSACHRGGIRFVDWSQFCFFRT